MFKREEEGGVGRDPYIVGASRSGKGLRTEGKGDKGMKRVRVKERRWLL